MKGMDMRFWILSLVLILSSCKEPPQNVDFDKNIKERIDSLISANDFNGVVLITKDSVDLYRNVEGFSDIENNTSLLRKDQFVIGSISKQITAVLVLKEVETGSLKLDSPIDAYLNEIDQPWSSQVNVHHLLTHTHGIESLEDTLSFQPGSEFKYSQIGYQILSEILEQVTRKTFIQLSADLFSEYGLSSTCHPDLKKHKRLVKGYTLKDGNYVFETNTFYNYVPAGGFVSNAQDLIKWNNLLHSGHIVSKKTLQLMSTKYATRKHPIFGEVDYGYGLIFSKDEAHIEIGALGYAPGFASASYYYPQSKVNLIVLSNAINSTNGFKQVFKVHNELMDLVKKDIN